MKGLLIITNNPKVGEKLARFEQETCGKLRGGSAGGS